VREWLAEAKKGGGPTVKRLEGARKRLKANLDLVKDPGDHFRGHRD
jgi:hypothetical protein